MFQNDFTLTQHNFISLTVLEVTLPFQKKQRSTHFTSRLSKASTLFQKLIGNLSHPKVLTKNDNLLPYYFGDASGKVIKEKEKRLTSFIPNNNWTTASQKTVFQLRASHLFFPAILLLKKHQKKFQWSLYKCFLFFFHLAIDLIKKLLTTDPQKRITVDGALQHPWISVSVCPWTRTVYIPTWLLVLGVFFSTPMYVRSWPRVRSRWLDLERVLFLRSYGSRQVEIHKKEKMNEANIQSSWPKKLGQWRIYFMVKKKQYLFEGKDSQPVLLQN